MGGELGRFAGGGGQRWGSREGKPLRQLETDRAKRGTEYASARRGNFNVGEASGERKEIPVDGFQIRGAHLDKLQADNVPFGMPCVVGYFGQERERW